MLTKLHRLQQLRKQGQELQEMQQAQAHRLQQEAPTPAKTSNTSATEEVSRGTNLATTTWSNQLNTCSRSRKRNISPTSSASSSSCPQPSTRCQVGCKCPTFPYNVRSRLHKHGSTDSEDRSISCLSRLAGRLEFSGKLCSFDMHSGWSLGCLLGDWMFDTHLTIALPMSCCRFSSVGDIGKPISRVMPMFPNVVHVACSLVII